nr:carcinoembryonic antigen-related cell adhesion molecule 21-like isoform X6 [Odocoileus virginianus texanus]
MKLHRERGQHTAGPMEPPSGPASRRHVPWNRLLLAVALLSFWPPPTTARLTVDTVPPLAAEGSIVVFNILGKEGLVLGYGWFRGNRVDRAAAIDVYQILNNSFTPGPANTGRETIKPNGSLIIQSVQKRDSGTYTVVTVKADLTNVSASGDLQVYSLLQQPSIQVSDPMDRDKENKVVITCNTNETDISIKWIFNGQYIKAAKNIFLSEDGKKLTIDPIKKENAGKYQCEIFNIGTSNRSGIFELKVKKSSLFDLTTGTVVGILVVTSVCLGLIAALVYFLFFK